MISALEAYKSTTGRTEPQARVRAEITRLEAFIKQAGRDGKYETSYDASIGNPRVAGPSGTIESAALSAEQREFLDALESAGYSVTMDKTKKWNVSWSDSRNQVIADRVGQLETGKFDTLEFATKFITPEGNEFTKSTGSGLLLGGGTQLQGNLATTVDMPVNGTYYPGPKITQGIVGVWLIVGHVTCRDTATTGLFRAKITDGASDFSMGISNTTAANNMVTITIAAIVTNPTADLRIMVANFGNGGASTTGQILGNTISSGLDSVITGFRVG